MMKMKKLISSNKVCTFAIFAAMGAAAGILTAKFTVSRCCCAEKLKSKAKKALKNMEEML